MSARIARRSATQVRDGRVQPKNRRDESAGLRAPSLDQVVLDRERPGPGARHVLHKTDLERFLPLIPDWDELAVGLETILLAAADGDTEGFHEPRLVAICAWPKDLWESVHPEHYAEHRQVMDAIGVEATRTGDAVLLKWTEPQVRAYQLLHVLMHELGHHHDRMTTRSQTRTARGEPFAETYAQTHFTDLLERYTREFAL